jgi:hypothetical protein
MNRIQRIEFLVMLCVTALGGYIAVADEDVRTAVETDYAARESYYGSYIDHGDIMENVAIDILHLAMGHRDHRVSDMGIVNLSGLFDN